MSIGEKICSSVLCPFVALGGAALTIYREGRTFAGRPIAYLTTSNKGGGAPDYQRSVSRKGEGKSGPADGFLSPQRVAEDDNAEPKRKPSESATLSDTVSQKGRGSSSDKVKNPVKKLKIERTEKLEAGEVDGVPYANWVPVKSDRSNSNSTLGSEIVVVEIEHPDEDFRNDSFESLASDAPFEYTSESDDENSTG